MEGQLTLFTGGQEECEAVVKNDWLSPDMKQVVREAMSKRIVASAPLRPMVRDNRRQRSTAESLDLDAAWDRRSLDPAA